MKIVLIGFMGSGKTTVGKILASKLSTQFVDTDEYIENALNKKISDIFKDEGESYFRQMETKAIGKICDSKEDLVISVGGGLPVLPINREIMADNCEVFYLRAETDTLLKRLEGDNTRPLLKGDNLRDKIVRLFGEREAIYNEAAPYKIDTDGCMPEEIADIIIKILQAK